MNCFFKVPNELKRIPILNVLFNCGCRHVQFGLESYTYLFYRFFSEFIWDFLERPFGKSSKMVENVDQSFSVFLSNSNDSYIFLTCYPLIFGK